MSVKGKNQSESIYCSIYILYMNDDAASGDDDDDDDDKGGDAVGWF